MKNLDLKAFDVQELTSTETVSIEGMNIGWIFLGTGSHFSINKKNTSTKSFDSSLNALLSL